MKMRAVPAHLGTSSKIKVSLERWLESGVAYGVGNIPVPSLLMGACGFSRNCSFQGGNTRNDKQRLSTTARQVVVYTMQRGH
jgi:hypothetical protein